VTREVKALSQLF